MHKEHAFAAGTFVSVHWCPKKGRKEDRAKFQSAAAAVVGTGKYKSLRA